MKVRFWAFFLGACTLLPGWSQAACPDVALDVDVVSSYVSTTTGVRLDGHPALQPSFTVSCDAFDGTVYGNVWTTIGIDNGPTFSSDAAGEVDYTVGYFRGRDFGPYVDVSLSYFDVIRLGVGREDVAQVGLETGWEVQLNDRFSVAPYVRVEPQFFLGSAPNGAYVHVGARGDYQVSDRFRISPQLYVVHDTGAGGVSSGQIGHGRLELNFSLTDSLTLAPFGKVAFPISDFDDHRESEVVGGFRLKWKLPIK